LKKKLIKRIAVITFFFVTGFSIIGCSRESVPNKNSQPPSVTQSNSVEEKIRIVENNASEAGPGPLTKENVSLAGIHIGDSQEQVLKLYGEPTKKEMVHSTPFLGWYYENLGLSVSFYRRGEREPIEGVVDIQISEPSKLRTNMGIGIGDSLESIVNRYTEVCGYKPDETNSQYIFITGTNKTKNENLGFVLYYPRLDILLKNNQISNIGLTNELERP